MNDDSVDAYKNFVIHRTPIVSSSHAMISIPQSMTSNLFSIMETTLTYSSRECDYDKCCVHACMEKKEQGRERERERALVVLLAVKRRGIRLEKESFVYLQVQGSFSHNLASSRQTKLHA
jgi:hypothetical protein